MSTLSERAESVHNHYEAERAKLLREDGTRRFADKEHAECQAALRTERNAVLDVVAAAADEEISRGEAAHAAHADRSALLSAEDVAAANARRAFVAEDAQDLPLDELATRAEAAASSGDKASMFLFARYGRARAERERAAQPRVEFTTEYERLQAALDQLGEGLSTPQRSAPHGAPSKRRQRYT
jgi:hypothetical protein